MKYKTFKESRYGRGSRDMRVAVLPLRGYVKGNTVAKQVASAADFFSVAGSASGSGGVVGKINREKVAILFTSGSGKSQYDHLMKKDSWNRELRHDQTFRSIGNFQPIGWFDYDETGILNSKGIKPELKINNSYTFK